MGVEAEIQHFLTNATSFAGDFFPIIVLAAALLLYSMYFGRDRFAPLIAGLYSALILYSAFPFSLSLMNGPFAKIVFYLVLTGASALAFSGLSHFVARAGSSFISSVLLSVAVAGFLIAIAIHTLPVPLVYHFSDATKALFASNYAYFWWLAAPLVALFFLR